VVVIRRAKTIFMAVKFESIIKKFLTGQLSILDDLFNLFVGQAQEDVLRFEICMDNSTNSVEEIQTHHHLPRDFLD
jgi:hypothetical protein